MSLSQLFRFFAYFLLGSHAVVPSLMFKVLKKVRRPESEEFLLRYFLFVISYFDILKKLEYRSQKFR